MTEDSTIDQTCVIIGAGHAGVNCAFALRREGWKGPIHLFDSDPLLPYHRPPLSKAFLQGEGDIGQYLLKPAESYESEEIKLHLGISVRAIHREEKRISLKDGSMHTYDQLVIATGARPFFPSIQGLDQVRNLFVLRTATDADQIQEALKKVTKKEVVIIGGGYIGLETAASLRKLGAAVTVLEREDRVLARVTAPELSAFFERLHAEKGVQIFTGKTVVSVDSSDESTQIHCLDGSVFRGTIVILGVGIQVNTALADSAGLEIENGIRVNSAAQTSDPYIYAIGDCTYHYNSHYNRYIRLESVQNAVDQAKVAAASICGKVVSYDTIPWFWSDQYEVKLQMVGLSAGYTEVVIRKENGKDRQFSIWYFKGDELLAVDAVNHAKAYVLGTKFIKNGKKINKSKLLDPQEDLQPVNLLL